MQRFGIQAQQTFRCGDFRPIQNILDLNAISAGIHRDCAADAAGNTDQKFKPGKPRSGSGFRHGHIKSSGTGNDAIGFHHHITETARKPQHYARNATITNDQIGSSTQHRQRHVSRHVAQQQHQIIQIGGPHQQIRCATHAKPCPGAKWRVTFHATTQGGQHGLADGLEHHFIAPAKRPRARACKSVNCAGSACAQLVMLPAPRQTT